MGKIVIVILSLFVLVGCATTEKPPFVPVVFTIDNDFNINITTSASVSAELVTLVGTFGLRPDLPIISDDEILLIIRNLNQPDGKQNTVYKIDSGRNIRVVTDGLKEVNVSSTGIVQINITNSTIRRIMIEDSPPECGGIPSRHKIDDTVIVDSKNGGTLPITTHPDGEAKEILTQIYDGDSLTLVDGPVCISGESFWEPSGWVWQVSSFRDGISGWATENNGNEIYLCPYIQPECNT